jgi:hypothetical protein
VVYVTAYFYAINVDELLQGLQRAKCGYYLGITFARELGYTDDIDVLPFSMNVMLNICGDYPIGYSVKSNVNKTKSLTCTCAKSGLE